MSVLHVGCAMRVWSRARASATRSRGFTAVELLVVLSIVAVLAALAAPSFNTLIESWRVRDAREGMTSSLFLARSEAIKRAGSVVLEKTPLGTDCPHASGNQFWSCGWLLYVDANGNGSRDANEGIQSFPAPKRMNVELSSTGVIPNPTKLTFDRWGVPNLSLVKFLITPYPSNTASPATTTLCITGGGTIRYLPGDVSCS